MTTVTRERRRWFQSAVLWGLCCSIACGSRPTPTPPAVPPALASANETPPSAAPVSVELPRVSEAPCAIADGITRRAIAEAQTHADLVAHKLIDSGAYTGPPLARDPSYDVPRFLNCQESPAGAWALVLKQAQLAPQVDWDWSGQWMLDGYLVLVHVERDGRVDEREIGTQTNGNVSSGDFYNQPAFEKQGQNCCSFVFGGPDALEFFDFDGDGEPEVHVGASYGHEGVSERTDELLTFHAGKIATYRDSGQLGFHTMKDETGDGRPDLLLSRSVTGSEDCGSGFPSDGSGLTFLAHSLPDGGFSLDDPEARAFARHQCASPPAALNSFQDVLCARIWGAAPDELARKVRASSAPWDCAAERANRPQKAKARGDYELMLNSTDTWIPFTLP